MTKLCLLTVLGLCLVGCGSGSGSTENNVTMQGGQWEYVVTPGDGSTTMYIEANVPQANAKFSGTNAVIFQPSQIGAVDSTSPIYCGGYDLNADITGSSLKGKFSIATQGVHFADFSGDLASNGQSISNGKYSGGACSVLNLPEVKGKFSGYTIAPINGTYTGTLTSSLYGPDVVTLSIKQNPDFSLTVSGTSVENGVSTVLVGSNLNSDTSVKGATVAIFGPSQNVNGSTDFTINAHANPAATQLTVAYMNFGPDEMVTGVLTRQ